MLVHVRGLPADERLVTFNFAGQLDERSGFHRLADSVEHEPRGFLRDADRSAEFVRTDSVFAIRNAPHGDKPLVEAERTILEDRPRLERELRFARAGVALEFRTILDRRNAVASALRADDLARRPFDVRHELVALFQIGKVADGFNQGCGNFGDHRSSFTIERMLLRILSATCFNTSSPI